MIKRISNLVTNTFSITKFFFQYTERRTLLLFELNNKKTIIDDIRKNSMLILVRDSKLRSLLYQSLLDLSTEEGINASSKDEVYGCIFGRDSAITVLKILRTHSKKPVPALLQICKNTLLTLVKLQGKQFNIENGEELGKFIHEFRRDKYEHLTKIEKPWFVYPDQTLRNYDSIDSTPLSLIAIYKYWKLTDDHEFLITVLPVVEAGLNWIITYGDKDKDLFLEYEFPPQRQYGGLAVQSWTDSSESLMQPDGSLPKYPIAPIEAQSYAWLAIKLWSKFYSTQSSEFAQKLAAHAKVLKEEFNKKFIFKDKNLYYGAQVLDGYKKQIKTITANPMLCLWAADTEEKKVECIVDDKYIDDFVKRAFMDDLFDKDAGIRTMSTLSMTYNPNQDSYHNGSFWPMLNGLIIEGLENFGFAKEAKMLTHASIKPIKYFGFPAELYIKQGKKYFEYCSPSGQLGCRQQAWSAAALLDALTNK